MGTLYPGRVRLRSGPAPRGSLAWGAALVGVIGLVSALTPEMANRVELVRGILPPGWPEAARVLTVAFGIGLIWLSRSLAKRRRRRAWQLAVAVVVASAVGAPREGPRLRGGDDLAASARRARPLGGAASTCRATPRASGRCSASAQPSRGSPRSPAGPSCAASSCRTAPATRSSASASASGSRAVLLAAALRARRRADGGGAPDGAGARRRLRQRQPLLLRPAPRQELSLLAVPPCLPRVPRRRGDALVSGDPVGDEAESTTCSRSCVASSARTAGGSRSRRVGRAPRPLSRARAAPGADRGGGGAPPAGRSRSKDVPSARCASRSRGSEGRILFRIVPADEPPGSRAASSTTFAARGAARAGARLLDGDRRPPCPRHLLALAEDADGTRRRLSPSRALPAGRRLVVERDAAPPERPERPDRVSRGRDARLGREHGRERAVPQLLRADGLPRAGTGERPRRVVRRGSCSPTTSSSSSGSTPSTGSSSRNGGPATSASRGSPTCPLSGSRTSMPSRCSCRPARGRAGARPAAAPSPSSRRQARRVAFSRT